jgi:hypothetical protein
MTLFTLKIANRRGATLGFLFNDEDQCKTHYADILQAMAYGEFEEEHGLTKNPRNHHVQIKDDFGNTGVVDCSDVGWVWMTDFEKELDGQKEVEMLKAHANAALQRKAAADPLLRPPAMAAPPSGLIDLTQRRN